MSDYRVLRALAESLRRPDDERMSRAREDLKYASLLMTSCMWQEYKKIKQEVYSAKSLSDKMAHYENLTAMRMKIKQWIKFLPMNS